MSTSWKADFWHSRALFVLASLGGCIGLSNFWGFPAAIEAHGGSAFLLLYFAIAVFFAFPMIFAQVAAGRAIGKDPIHSIGYLLIKSKRSEFGAYLVFAGMLAAVALVVVSAIFGAWVIQYLEEFIRGSYTGITPEQATVAFEIGYGNTTALLSSLALFMFLLLIVSAGNMHYDLFWAIKVLVPMMLCALVASLAYSSELSGFTQAVRDLFEFHPNKLSLESARYAATYAFYTFLLGAGVMVILGSYMPKQGRIDTPIHIVIMLDLVFAVLIAVVMSTLLKSYGSSVNTGPTLLFVDLPTALGHLPHGQIMGILIYSSLLLSIWTSAQLLLEPGIAWLEERYEVHRYFAALVLLIPVGVASAALMWALSTEQQGKFAFAMIDFVAGYLVLPAAALAMTLLMGWRVKPAFWMRALYLVPSLGIRLWLLLLRYLCPVGILGLWGWNIYLWSVGQA